ncbi:uncharacterized protein RAG0_07396 [Rhynchosporium agropyri]|uniref:Uncharacterized protein n=1 Tax=Rhynchosporium agropyri TaxID=914238 RepID=A0A1E1KLD8_9HELO|nr:uncharacterized protein RAG0_07396 [Rhynchosporium agropyri]
MIDMHYKYCSGCKLEYTPDKLDEEGFYVDMDMDMEVVLGTRTMARVALEDGIVGSIDGGLGQGELSNQTHASTITEDRE